MPYHSDRDDDPRLPGARVEILVVIRVVTQRSHRSCGRRGCDVIDECDVFCLNDISRYLRHVFFVFFVMARKLLHE